MDRRIRGGKKATTRKNCRETRVERRNSKNNTQKNIYISINRRVLHTLRDLKRFFHGPSSSSSDANEPNCWKVVKKRVCEEHAKCNTTTHKVSSKDLKYTLIFIIGEREKLLFILHCFRNSLSLSWSTGERTGPRMRTQSSYEYVLCLMEKLQLSLYICRIEWVEI